MQDRSRRQCVTFPCPGSLGSRRLTAAHVHERTRTDLSAKVLLLDHHQGLRAPPIPPQDQKRSAGLSSQCPAAGVRCVRRGEGAVVEECQHVCPIRVGHIPCAHHAPSRVNVLVFSSSGRDGAKQCHQEHDGGKDKGLHGRKAGGLGIRRYAIFSDIKCSDFSRSGTEESRARLPCLHRFF
jgi:hypothetical protein